MHSHTAHLAEESPPQLGRLAWQTLMQIALGLSIALVVLTFCCYWQIKDNLTSLALKNLEEYVDLNRDRENIPFNEIQQHQEILRDEILQGLQSPINPAAVEESFGRMCGLGADGVWRSTEGKVNPQKQAGIFIGAGSSPNLASKNRLLVAAQKCATYGSAWQIYSINHYFMTPQNSMAVFWPSRPDFITSLPTDFDVTKMSYYAVGAPENNPGEKTIWTGLYYNPFVKLWLCSAVTPVYDTQGYIGSVGSDLLLDDLIGRIRHDNLVGSYTFLVRRDGELVTHPWYREQIVQAKGRYTVSDTQDSTLQDFYRIALTTMGKKTVTLSSDGAFYLGLAYLPGPDWMMITVYPRSMINKAALKSAKFIMVLGLATLFLSLTLVYLILWNKVGKPLQIMNRVTSEVAQGNLKVKIDLTQQNELGEMARSFNTMVEKLAEREATLRANMLEKEKAERKILEAQKLESLAVLAGGIAHDFNNLLTGILGNTCMARAEIPAQSPLLGFLDKIDNCSRRAAELCKQMLAYSGKGRFQITRLHLNNLIEETSELLRVSILKDSKLIFNLGANLPPIMADASQVRQVLMNLVLNASEAIGAHEGVIRLTTSLFYLSDSDLQECIHWPNLSSGEYVMLEVQDTGQGMSTDVMSKMFDPFFSTKFTGRGLGLAAVLGIMRGHKGAIQVRSKPGYGCTFRVLFPASTATVEAPASPAPTAIESNGENAPVNGLALVVDDEIPVREIATRMMQKIGFQTIVAKDGQEAVELFRQHEQELAFVLMDLTMPVLDGLAAAIEIHRQRPELPVMIMSGYNEKDAIGHMTTQGLAGFIQKPFDLNALRQKVQQVLHK